MRSSEMLALLLAVPLSITALAPHDARRLSSGRVSSLLQKFNELKARDAEKFRAPVADAVAAAGPSAACPAAFTECKISVLVVPALPWVDYGGPGIPCEVLYANETYYVNGQPCFGDADGDGFISPCEVHALFVESENIFRGRDCPGYPLLPTCCPFSGDVSEMASQACCTPNSTMFDGYYDYYYYDHPTGAICDDRSEYDPQFSACEPPSAPPTAPPTTPPNTPLDGPGELLEHDTARFYEGGLEAGASPPTKEMFIVSLVGLSGGVFVAVAVLGVLAAVIKWNARERLLPKDAEQSNQS